MKWICWSWRAITCPLIVMCMSMLGHRQWVNLQESHVARKGKYTMGHTDSIKRLLQYIQCACHLPLLKNFIVSAKHVCLHRQDKCALFQNLMNAMMETHIPSTTIGQRWYGIAYVSSKLSQCLICPQHVIILAGPHLATHKWKHHCVPYIGQGSLAVVV